MSTTSKASQRIAALLDDNSFVEIGGLVTARATDFNLKPNETPSDGCITGYGTEPSVRCMPRKLQTSTILL